MLFPSSNRAALPWLIACLCWLALLGLASGQKAGAAAPPPGTAPDPLPPILSVEAAVQWALQFNPGLMTQRQQRGIAAAGVVIAHTYPYNPEAQNVFQAVNGPESSGTNFRLPFQTGFLLQVQVRGQGRYRRQTAEAALSRTDWEVAFQEQLLAVQVIRAFRTLQYRQEKLKLIELTIRMQEQALEQVRKLMEQGKLRGADLLLARTEVDAARAFLGAGRTLRTTAFYELRRALGAVDATFEIQGTLTPLPYPDDPNMLLPAALERRADLRAAQVAIAEAEARLRHTVADRFGDPFIGPAVNMDNTRDYYIGAFLNVPIPVLNTHRGDILQRKEEQARAVLAFRQSEITVRQDVQAALARLKISHGWANEYPGQTLPNLQSNLEGIEKLFLAGEPGVDVLRVIEVRRRLLQARDSYLDALWEVSQAEADLAAAAGDPTLALIPGRSANHPEDLPSPQRLPPEKSTP